MKRSLLLVCSDSQGRCFSAYVDIPRWVSMYPKDRDAAETFSPATLERLVYWGENDRRFVVVPVKKDAV